MPISTRSVRARVWCACLLAAATTTLSCGGGSSPKVGDPGDAQTRDTSPDAGAGPDMPSNDAAPADVSAPDASADDAADLAPANETIADTACSRADALAPSIVNQRPGDGNQDLHKVTLDFPDAVCNDGTPAVMFVRAASSDATANRWIVHLKGGGACVDADECVARWCNEQSPAYSAGTMSSRWTADTINGIGLFRRASESARVDVNPFAEANNVFVYYCSSDAWQGGATQARMTTTDGREYDIAFRGHTIVRAVFESLTQGVVSDDGAVTLPALQDGDQLLLTGSSAGGTGVTFNLDWVADRLRPSGVNVRGVIDAALAPRTQHLLDLLPADAVDEVARALAASAQSSYDRVVNQRSGILDESCVSVAADPVDCADRANLQLNHITTPFMVFANLADSNLSRSYNQAGVPDTVYAEAIYRTLSDLPLLPTLAAEGAEMTRAPGGFANACTQHTTLMSDTWFHGVSVGGKTEREALADWLSGQDVSLLETAADAGSNCAPTEATGD